MAPAADEGDAGRRRRAGLRQEEWAHPQHDTHQLELKEGHQPHRTEQSVGVAVLLRSDDRRAGVLLLRGVLGWSSFAATTGVLGAPPSRRRPEWWGAPPSRQRPECWGAPPSRHAGALLLRSDEQRAAVNGIEEGAAAAMSEEDLGFARNETRMERERPGQTGIRPTLTCGTHGALPLANFDSDSPAIH
jgi:hypothetical protein